MRRARPGRSADLSATDEQAIWARYGGSFTRADNDDRVDALLFAKKPDDAARFVIAGEPRRGRRRSPRGSRCSRIAPTPTAATQAVIGTVTSDAGLMMDRARYLRANNYRAARRSSWPPAPTISSTGPPIPSASTTC